MREGGAAAVSGRGVEMQRWYSWVNFRRPRGSPGAERRESMKVGRGYSGSKPGSSHGERGV